MTSAAADLQKAMFEVLNSNVALSELLGGAKIFDHAPAHVGFPYVCLGKTSLHDWSTSTESGVEHLVSLHVWSKARGKKETLEIIEAVQGCLGGAPLALHDNHLVDLRFESAEVGYDDNISLHHGLLRLRAVTEDDA